MSPHPHRIAIIGAGYAGTALVANLERFCDRPLQVYLIDRRGVFGLGDAYSTPYPFHLLNVRAEDMSALADEPNHFVHWLQSQPELLAQLDSAQPLPQQFVPRLFYGKYLQDLLQRIQQNRNSHLKLQMIHADIQSVEVQGPQAILKSQQHADLVVDKVVLATGNNPAGAFPFLVSPQVNCIHNPWDFTAPEQIAKNQRVLIVGTGLSMIDTVLTLHHQQHTGPIFALSRHGLLPLPHSETKTGLTLDINTAENLNTITRHLRKKSRAHMQGGGDWRSIISAFRSHIATVWKNASLEQRKRFIRHMLPYWNVHRHRVHQQIAQLLEDMIRTGKLSLLAGRVLQVDEQYAHIRLRGAQTTEPLAVDWLINCMGPQLTSHTASPLLQSLQQQGVAKFDELKLGLLTNEHGALEIKSGESSRMFYTLGALTKGTHWEITSVPDIRRQCLDLAHYLIE